ncbi:hypothetical protein WA171_004281 [Blastocystis sp. BT1]
MTNNKLKIHKEADLKNLANIQSSGRNVIEQNVVIHSDLGVVLIGQDTIIQNGSQITPCTQTINEKGTIQLRERPFISIGRGVIIQEDCQIQALRIGDQVGIGKGCVLNEGCVIKDNCVIDPHTVIPAYSVIGPFSHIGGNPCQLLEELPPSFFPMMRNYTSQIFDKYVSFPSFIVWNS